MYKFRGAVLLLFSYVLIVPLYSGNILKEPIDPRNPNLNANVSDLIISDNDDKENQINCKIEYKKKSGFFNKGIIKKFSGQYLNLTWAGNEIGSQEILIDFVKSISIKGYITEKKRKKNLSLVFYFPYLFDIELKNGEHIKNAKGRMKQLDSFVAYNSMGKEKCFTYFVRYWLEDRKIFNDNKSADYSEIPNVPKSVVIYIEFGDK